MHAFGTQALDGTEASIGAVQRCHAVAASHPRFTGGRDHHGVDVGSTQSTRGARSNAYQNSASGWIALLNAAASHRQPQRVIRCQQDLADHARRNRCQWIVSAPFVDGTVAANPDQTGPVADPEPASVVFEHRGRLHALEPLQRIGVHGLRRAIAIQTLDDAVHTTQPRPTIACSAEGAVHRALQAVGRPLQACRLTPVGAQVAQPPARHWHPQRTIRLGQQCIDHARYLDTTGAHRLGGGTTVLTP